MKYLLFTFALLIGCQSANAQAYNTAVGLRLGSGIGLSVQQRVANKMTVEGIVNSRLKKDQITATVLVEQHFPLLFKRFNVYAGLGAHKGWYSATPQDSSIAYKDPYGISFVGGAEISIGKFNVAYDFKPAYNIEGGERAFVSETSLTVRYIIAKRPTKLDKWKKKRKKKKNKKKKEKAKNKKKGKDDGFNLKDIFKRKK